MAVNIDRVYQTVLTLLNKEQRGFLPPDEFNELAQQSQVEIFETYFFELGRAEVQHGAREAEYGNIADHIFEKLEIFEITERATPGTGGTFDLPSNLYRLQTLVTDTGYDINMSTHKDIGYVLRSPLTAPVPTQPLYVRTGNSIQVFPNTGIAGVDVHFIRDLSTLPRWAGVVMDGQLVQSSASVNFELHASEEPELVAKILGYAGVVVKAQDVAAAGATLTAAIQQNEQ